MKVINASFFIKGDQRDNFLSDTKELISETRKEDGCLAYNLYESLEERNTFIFEKNQKKKKIQKQKKL